jgi:phosphoribosylamine--glycine ligase
MTRLKDDLLVIMLAAANNMLNQLSIRWSDEAALTVVMAAEGYPASPRKGTVIKGVEDADALPDVKVFHAGTVHKDGDLLANGGRVLNVTATGKTVSEAQEKAYQAISKIDWPEGFCRKDIGWRAVEREKTA